MSVCMRAWNKKDNIGVWLRLLVALNCCENIIHREIPGVAEVTQEPKP